MKKVNLYLPKNTISEEDIAVKINVNIAHMKSKEAWMLGFMYADGCITDNNSIIINIMYIYSKLLN